MELYKLSPNRSILINQWSEEAEYGVIVFEITGIASFNQSQALSDKIFTSRPLIPLYYLGKLIFSLTKR